MSVTVPHRRVFVCIRLIHIVVSFRQIPFYKRVGGIRACVNNRDNDVRRKPLSLEECREHIHLRPGYAPGKMGIVRKTRRLARFFAFFLRVYQRQHMILLHIRDPGLRLQIVLTLFRVIGRVKLNDAKAAVRVCNRFQGIVTFNARLTVLDCLDLRRVRTDEKPCRRRRLRRSDAHAVGRVA